MRELTVAEMGMVGGGNFLTDALDWARMGGEVGAIVGFVVTETAAGAARGGLVGAAAGFSFSIGYSFGSTLYNAFCG